MVRIYTDIEALKPTQPSLASSACLYNLWSAKYSSCIVAILKTSFPTSYPHLHRLYPIVPARFRTNLASANSTLVSITVALLWEKAYVVGEGEDSGRGSSVLMHPAAYRVLIIQSLHHHLSSSVAMPLKNVVEHE